MTARQIVVTLVAVTSVMILLKVVCVTVVVVAVAAVLHIIRRVIGGRVTGIELILRV
jgi:hypothetical protein